MADYNAVISHAEAIAANQDRLAQAQESLHEAETLALQAAAHVESMQHRLHESISRLRKAVQDLEKEEIAESEQRIAEMLGGDR